MPPSRYSRPTTLGTIGSGRGLDTRRFMFDWVNNIFGDNAKKEEEEAAAAAKAKAEAEAKKKAEEEAAAIAEQAAKEKAEAEARAKQKALDDAAMLEKAKAEAEAKFAEFEAQQKAEQEAIAAAAAKAKAEADEKAKKKAEEEAAAKAEEEAKTAAEAEAKKKAEEEAVFKAAAEAEAKKKADDEAEAAAKAEAEAKAAAEAESPKKAEEETAAKVEVEAEADAKVAEEVEEEKAAESSDDNQEISDEEASFNDYVEEVIAKNLRIKGVVQWYNPKKGFGFIKPFQTSDEEYEISKAIRKELAVKDHDQKKITYSPGIYVHHHSIYTPNETFFRKLYARESVEFEICHDNEGRPTAKDVKGPDGTNVKAVLKEQLRRTEMGN